MRVNYTVPKVIIIFYFLSIFQKILFIFTLSMC